MSRGLRNWVGLAALAAVALTGCGDDDDSGGTGVPGTGGGGGESADVAVEASDELDFGEDEYTAEAGEITFDYFGGRIQHSLVVEGHEDDMRLVISGDEETGSLELEAGEYLLYCDIPGHQSAGMEADLIVE
jgi:cytochrome c oxidase subunit 2